MAPQLDVLTATIFLRAHQLFKKGDTCSSETCRENAESRNESLPVFSLPTEVTAYIFTLCQKSIRSKKTTVWERFGTIPFEIVISQIARHWRYVAIGTPVLWNRIKFSIGDSSQKLEVYLERSGGGPLNLRLYSLTKISERDLQNVRHLLLPHFSRFRSFMIYFSNAQNVGNILSWFKTTSFDQLSHCALVRCPEDDSEDPHNISDVLTVPGLKFTSAAVLESLDLGILLPDLTSVPSVKRLRVQMALPRSANLPDVGNWQQMLGSFSNLTSLTIEFWAPIEDTTKIDFPVLTNLRLVYTSWRIELPVHRYLFRVLTRILTPKLEVLVIKCQSGKDVALLFTLLSGSISQDYRRLRMLSFSGLSFKPPEKTDWASMRIGTIANMSNPFEHVEHVAFVNLDNTSQMLSHLFLNPDFVTPRLPRLRSLTVGSHLLQPGFLKNIFSQRMSSGCAIRQLNVHPSVVKAIGSLLDARDWFLLNCDVRVFDADDFLVPVDLESKMIANDDDGERLLNDDTD